jgi:hypothetical protein
MNIQEQLAIVSKLKRENKNSVIGYALDCEIKIEQLETELNAWRKTFGTNQLTHALARL